MTPTILYSSLSSDDKMVSESLATSNHHIHLSHTYFEMIKDMDPGSISTRIIFLMQISLQDFPQEFKNDSIIFTMKDFNEESDLISNLYLKNRKFDALQQSYQRQASQDSKVR
jgi:hypothetical protein